MGLFAWFFLSGPPRSKELSDETSCGGNPSKGGGDIRTIPQERESWTGGGEMEERRGAGWEV